MSAIGTSLPTIPWDQINQQIDKAWKTLKIVAWEVSTAIYELGLKIKVWATPFIARFVAWSQLMLNHSLVLLSLYRKEVQLIVLGCVAGIVMTIFMNYLRSPSKNHP